MELSGTITSGEGAGDVIMATSHAGLPTLHCRIVACGGGLRSERSAQRSNGQLTPTFIA